MSQCCRATTGVPNDGHKTWSVRFLLLIAGLGGLLYGIDLGIIASALPYLQATAAADWKLGPQQLSFIVAAVGLGTILSCLVAGMLSDLFGRRSIMFLSGLLFVISIPLIALAHGYMPLMLGRLLQGISGGLVGVVVPLYLAECLPAKSRGKGTGIFQWLLMLGIFAAAAIGFYFSLRVSSVEQLNDPAALLAYKDTAWRGIFWVSLPPGILFVIGSLMVAESPRWLFRRGKKEAALAALLRTRTPEQAAVELQEMEQTAAAENANVSGTGEKIRESLLHRKYVVPFVLACLILSCNQATGVNSIIAYNATILIQAGLGDLPAHLGYVVLTLIGFLMTIVGIVLVDRKGRKFLLSLCTAVMTGTLLCTAFIFQHTEKQHVDASAAVQALVDSTGQAAQITFNQAKADQLLADTGERGKEILGRPCTLVIIYSYGDFRGATNAARSDDKVAKPIKIAREDCVPESRLGAILSHPFASLEEARTAPLKIENALITPVPSTQSGWLTAACIFCFMAFYSAGPGVCVWLALSELMPTRIRSNGMSIALLLNQAVAAGIAAVFLPTVGAFGYATMFFAFAACTVVYFVTAFFFLPETKGKTLEEIEEYFSGHKQSA